MAKAVGDKRGLTRYGHAYVPLDEALSRVVIDFSGRPSLEYHVPFTRSRVGEFDVDLCHEFFQGFVESRDGDAARRQSAWRQQPSSGRDVVQSVRPRVAHGADAGSAARQDGAVDERQAVSSPMLVIPAIDIKDGQCVRLRQGRMDDVTVFGTDPVAMARHWFAEGCKRLHLVDLDGAVSGTPRNAAIIRAISADARRRSGAGRRRHPRDRNDQRLPRCRRRSGDHRHARRARAGRFSRKRAPHFPDRILLGLDARDGMIATDGWESTSNESAVAFASRVAHLALAGIVYTDIARDGMGSGLNVAATIDLAEQSGVAVIASGGVRDLEHLRELARAAQASRGTVLGVIIGRALYEGTLELASRVGALLAST